MFLFKKKTNTNKEDIYDIEKSKLLPTYYEKYSKNVEIKKNCHEFQLVNNKEDEFEIYYYGNLLKKHFIIGTNDIGSLVVAKDKQGNEIVIFDGCTHGYDNLAWQEYNNQEINFKRNLQKLDIGFVKVYISIELLNDSEEDWDLDADNNVIGDQGKKTPWEIFKRNAITWLTINVTTSKNKNINIVDEELA